MRSERWHQHAWNNRCQTALLIAALIGISALTGFLLFGETGLWIAVGAGVIALLVEPSAAGLTLRLYRARLIAPAAAPGLWQMLEQIAARAGLPVVPVPHYVPSPLINAFAAGSRERPAIALTHGLLEQLSPRELAGVLAHEVAHIAHGDLRVMGLADYVSRLTSLFSLLGQVLILLALPWLLLGEGEINGWGLLLLIAAPHLATLSQLGLSRVREFDADLKAAAFTGDPRGLASALARIEGRSRSWKSLLLPGWGNPEPSWLRTHPSTDERIRRLLELAPQREEWPASLTGAYRPPRASLRAQPRWSVGGLWR